MARAQADCAPQSYALLGETNLSAVSALAGVPLSQNPQHGGLEVLSGSQRFALEPSALTGTQSGNIQMLLLPAVQRVIFQGGGQTLTIRPVVQSPCALQQALAQFGLGFGMDGDGIITIPAGPGAAYLARPDWHEHCETSYDSRITSR